MPPKAPNPMPEVLIPVHAIKGRGSARSIAHRFARDARAGFDDGWGTVDEMAMQQGASAPPATAPAPKAALPGVPQASDAEPIKTAVSSQACGLSQAKAKAAHTAWRRSRGLATMAAVVVVSSSGVPETGLQKREKACAP